MWKKNVRRYFFDDPSFFFWQLRWRSILRLAWRSSGACKSSSVSLFRSQLGTRHPDLNRCDNVHEWIQLNIAVPNLYSPYLSFSLLSTYSLFLLVPPLIGDPNIFVEVEESVTYYLNGPLFPSSMILWIQFRYSQVLSRCKQNLILIREQRLFLDCRRRHHRQHHRDRHHGGGHYETGQRIVREEGKQGDRRYQQGDWYPSGTSYCLWKMLGTDLANLQFTVLKKL